jgi:hypothetical protein
MTDDVVPRGLTPLSVAALAYAGAATVASVISVRDDVPGRPFGIRVGMDVPAALAVGWGSGIAPPWPMPALVLISASRTRWGHRRAAAVAATIGACSIVGHAIEPVTWRREEWTPLGVAAATTMLAASVALVLTGAATYRSMAQVERVIVAEPTTREPS